MKTLRFDDKLSLDNLVWRDVPDPGPPGPGEILVRVRAVSLNYRDLAIARGQYPGGPLPLIPGSDAAGEILAVGPGVTRAAPGDLVCATYVPDWIDGPPTASSSRRRRAYTLPGVFSQLLRLPEAEVVRAPRTLDAAHAATLPAAATTAWQALVADAPTRPGDTVVVQGTGGVSLFALAFARAAGARVLMLTRDERHAPALRALGAAEVLPLGATETWPDAVLERTAGAGADAVVDVVGPTLTLSMAATRIGGTVHVIGFVGGATTPLDLVVAMRRAVTLRAATTGSRATFEALVRAIDAHGIRPAIDRVFPAVQAREAFAHLASGGHLGKIVVEMD